MKTAILLILLIISENLYAQEIEVAPLYYEFGVISDAETVSYFVTIRNKGDEVLKILDIKLPCSCTVATPHTREFGPGESGEIKIIFDPRNRQGYLRWEVSIITNLQQTPIRIAFDATVLKDDLVSHRMLYFEEFERGACPEKRVWISPRDSRSWNPYTILGYPLFSIQQCYVEVDGRDHFDHFDIQCLPCIYDGFYPGPGLAYSIRITPKSDIPFGRFQGKLCIFTDIPGHEKIAISIMGKVVGEIGVSRDYLAMGIIAQDRPVSKRLMVYNRKGNPFKIYEVRSSVPFLTMEVENVIPDQYYEICVIGKVADDSPEGEFRGELTITTSSEEQPHIVVMVQGFVQHPKLR